MFSRRQHLGHPHKPTAAEVSLPEKPACIKVNGRRGRGARSSSRPHLPSSQRKPASDLPPTKGSTLLAGSGIAAAPARPIPASVGIRRTTRWSRPGQPEVMLGAILALAGRAAHLEAVRRPSACPLDVPFTVMYTGDVWNQRSRRAQNPDLFNRDSAED